MDIKSIITNLTDTKTKKIIVGAVVAALVILIVGLFILGNMGKPLDPDNNEMVTITIESGSGTSVIAQILEDNGIIDNPTQFKLWSRLKGYDNQYKAGNYKFSPSMSFKEIAAILIGGKVNTISFTIPEGYNIYQVADALSAQGLIDKDTFIDLLENGDFQSQYEFLKDAQNNKNRLEGYLFPNTYFVAEGASEEEFIKVMLNQFDVEITDAHYKKAKELDLSMNEVIIIASIIERECKLAEEAPLVASVIYNRLDIGMALQMCSTVQYVLGETKEVLSYADTQIQSPYNTYINAGLPPGPICSPGLVAIEAALNPANTDYIYFVLSEKLDGSSNFSTNYSDFQKDSAAYSAAYDAAKK